MACTTVIILTCARAGVPSLTSYKVPIVGGASNSCPLTLRYLYIQIQTCMFCMFSLSLNRQQDKEPDLISFSQFLHPTTTFILLLDVFSSIISVYLPLLIDIQTPSPATYTHNNHHNIKKCTCSFIIYIQTPTWTFYNQVVRSPRTFIGI